MPEAPPETHPCPVCGKPTPNEREEILGIASCIECTPKQPDLMGVMSYDGKTAGTLFMTRDKKLFNTLKKAANDQR